MKSYALFVKHRTKPGRRDEVQAVWRKHMQPAITANTEHEIYVYSFGVEADSICAFQFYSDAAAAERFLECQAYKNYQAEVTPLLDGPPEVHVLKPKWIKT